MTAMLASVRSAEEAEIALAGGADIIDLKDPAKGALPVESVRAIIARIARRRPVSAAVGDLPMDPSPLLAAARDMAGAGVDYVKVGLFPDAKRPDCIRALAGLSGSVRLIGVMFADREPDLSLFPLMKEAGLAGAMVDTAGKGEGRLLDHMSAAEIAAFAAACREFGFLCGLAGSLEAPDVPRLLPYNPDYLGFRGALCRARDREAGLDAVAFAAIRDLIPRQERRADLHVLAERLHAGHDGSSESADRIHVRELVLPVTIGAYASEHGKPQRVRFDVTVEVRRRTHPPEDMRHVFSYDVIIDAIKALAGRGHIVLVEALAERIAQALLGHAEVSSTTVRVEKLDLGPAAVGVEITRRRIPETASVHRLLATSIDPAP